MALTAAPPDRVLVRPIGADDQGAVGEFLHRHLNERVAPESWARAMDVPWAVDQPNAGFMLLDGDRIVGAHLAYYSQREIDGRRERFCNLGAWCVLPDHRFHALRLLRALLAQEGYHFTDLSPSGNVIGLNERLGFQHLESATALSPNLPWPRLPGGARVIADPQRIERLLTGRDLEIYRDHVGAAAAHQVVLVRGDRHCHVIFRKDRRKGLPLFASLLHVSDPETLRTARQALSRHVLLRHGIPALLAEDRVARHRPRLALRLRKPRRKMFRSRALDAAQIDNLYSELVCLPW